VTSRTFSGGPDRDRRGFASVLAGQRLINIGWSCHRCCARRPVPRRGASEQQRQRARHPWRCVAEALRRAPGATSYDRLRDPWRTDVVDGLDLPVAADPSGELGRGGLSDGQAGDRIDGDGPPFLLAGQGRMRRVTRRAWAAWGKQRPPVSVAAWRVRCSWRPCPRPRCRWPTGMVRQGRLLSWTYSLGWFVFTTWCGRMRRTEQSLCRSGSARLPMPGRAKATADAGLRVRRSHHSAADHARCERVLLGAHPAGMRAWPSAEDATSPRRSLGGHNPVVQRRRSGRGRDPAGRHARLVPCLPSGARAAARVAG
jgi:hypothetical protein